MKRLLALLALPLFLLTACQQGDYSYDDTPQGNLDVLWTIIDQRYCLLSYKEEQLGLRWSDLRAKYSAKLNADMSRVQLFEVLCQMLSELKDGHVNLATSLDLGRNWSWKEDYPENLNTELRRQYLGTDYHIGSGLMYTILPDNIAYVVYESFSDAIGDGNLIYEVQQNSNTTYRVYDWDRVDAQGNVIRTGEQVLIDNQAEIRYIGLCYRHWKLGKSHG